MNFGTFATDLRNNLYKNTMENSETIDTPQTDIRIDLVAAQYLSTAAGWARFLAILGFIASAAIVIGGMVAAIAFSDYGRGSSGPLLVFMLIYGSLMFLPALWLFNFAQKSRMAIDSNDSEDLKSALKNLKNFFLFQGIMIIVTLSVYLVIIMAVGL